MEITICPKCDASNGYLVFRPAGNSKNEYPYVGHYDSSKGSRTRWCYLTKKSLSNVKPVNSIDKQIIEKYLNNNAIKNELSADWKNSLNFLSKNKVKIAKLMHILHKDHPEKYNEFLSTKKDMEKSLKTICIAHQDPLKVQRLETVVLSEWITYLAWTYYLYVKLPKFHLSKKQFKKIATLRRKEVLQIDNPKSMDQALQYKFVGIQCKNCASWRVDEKYVSMKFRTFHCYACGKDFNRPLSLQNLVSAS
ncbi:MAG: hypothetical protein ACREAD_04765 [Nitrosopumilaceae archaeon]